ALMNQADNENPENRPYVYLVPTEQIVDWSFDSDGDLNGLVILEPTDADDPSPENAPQTLKDRPHKLKIWTNNVWQLWRAVFGKDGSGKKTVDYVFEDGDFNELGEIPFVPLYNDSPAPFKMYGDSEMVEVARMAQTVYNIDSKRDEIERKC